MFLCLKGHFSSNTIGRCWPLPLPTGADLSSVQSLSCVRLFVTPWTPKCQASESITNFRSLSNLMSIELVMPSKYLILYRSLLLCLQYFPAGFFQWVSSLHQVAKVLELLLQYRFFQWIILDSFPLGLTGLISMRSKGLSRVFSNITVKKQKFFKAHLSLWCNSHIHTWLLEKL